MKKPISEEPLKAEEGFEVRLRPRPAKPVSLNIPVDTLASLEKVATSRDMTVGALRKLYIGQRLRNDLAKLFADHVLEKTAEVLTRHIVSEEEVSAILKEIRVETTA